MVEMVEVVLVKVLEVVEMVDVLRISDLAWASSGPDENFLEQAVLHWFLDQRLLDPGAGRERGLTTHTNIHTRLEVQYLYFENFPGRWNIETFPSNYLCLTY